NHTATLIHPAASPHARQRSAHLSTFLVIDLPVTDAPTLGDRALVVKRSRDRQTIGWPEADAMRMTLARWRGAERAWSLRETRGGQRARRALTRRRIDRVLPRRRGATPHRPAAEGIRVRLRTGDPGLVRR